MENIYSTIFFPDENPSNQEFYKSLREGIRIRLSYLRKVYRNGKVHTVRVYMVRKTTYFKSITFQTGFVPYVEEFCRLVGLEVEIQDLRRKPEKPVSIPECIELGNIKLRDYQIRAIQQAIRCGRGILDMSVGSGKTEVACGIIKVLGLKTVFIVHTKALLYQTKKRIEERLGEEVGIIGDSIRKIRKVTVASIQSLYRHLKDKEIVDFLASVDVLFVDEAHHISNNTYQKVLLKTDAYYRFGLSGTPLNREDDGSMYVVGTLGKVVITITPEKLIQEGYLVQPEIHFVEFWGKNGEVDEKATSVWKEIYSRNIIENKDRNRLIASCVKQILTSKKRRILVIVKEVQHGKKLQEILEEELNCYVPFLWSKNFKMKERLVLQRFEEGKIPVLIASPIFDEGVDIPSIDVIVIAGGGKSYIKSIQRVGRGMRLAKGKDRLIVIDFIDYIHPILARHSALRMKAYAEEKFPIFLWDMEKQERKIIDLEQKDGTNFHRKLLTGKYLYREDPYVAALKAAFNLEKERG